MKFLEANEEEALIAKELANNVSFIAFCTDLIGFPMLVIANEDEFIADPEKDYPCIVFTIKQQSSDEEKLLRAMQFAIYINSDMKHQTVDNYRVYPDGKNTEKIAKEIFGLVKKKLCPEEISYFYEKIGADVSVKAIKGILEIVTSDTIKLGNKSW